MNSEENYLRLEEVKRRLKYKNSIINEIINRLIEILDDEQACNEGSLTEYDIVKIYELITNERV